MLSGWGPQGTLRLEVVRWSTERSRHVLRLIPNPEICGIVPCDWSPHLPGQHSGEVRERGVGGGPSKARQAGSVLGAVAEWPLDRLRSGRLDRRHQRPLQQQPLLERRSATGSDTVSADAGRDTVNADAGRDDGAGAVKLGTTGHLGAG
eukprot:6002373-Pyramimonas_sp.AAC.1